MKKHRMTAGVYGAIMRLRKKYILIVLAFLTFAAANILFRIVIEKTAISLLGFIAPFISAVIAGVLFVYCLDFVEKTAFRYIIVYARKYITAGFKLNSVKSWFTIFVLWLMIGVTSSVYFGVIGSIFSIILLKFIAGFQIAFFQFIDRSFFIEIFIKFSKGGFLMSSIMFVIFLPAATSIAAIYTIYKKIGLFCNPVGY
ncbi:MAG: hypothetical protein LBG76_04665 [Treponema sp.]|jgi:hypothetical protein|nr:hypothetical protein [Treponema sp.]